MQLDELAKIVQSLEQQLGRVVVGQAEVVQAMIVALIAEGHILMEGPPGTAKTLLARTFSASMAMDFNRIQFTPDLMPGDVIGTNLFNFQTSEFTLTKGPVFTDFLLADEINRTPPKTQSALLQAMQERSITLDGKTHELSQGFMVVATQNPIEQEGTYPMPEAQLDRFLFKVILDYPTEEQERKIIRLHGSRTSMPSLEDFGIKPIVALEDIVALRSQLPSIDLTDPIVNYLVSLIRQTREHASVLHGASPRAAAMLATAARARAAVQGRTFVIPDDIKALFAMTLRHRVVLSPGAEIEGLTIDQVLAQIIELIPAPR